jgi:hypothetical protein
LEWREEYFSVKDIGFRMKADTTRKIAFEEWLELTEDEWNIYFAETGMDRELDFNIENELEELYEKYLKGEKNK